MNTTKPNIAPLEKLKIWEQKEPLTPVEAKYLEAFRDKFAKVEDIANLLDWADEVDLDDSNLGEMVGTYPNPPGMFFGRQRVARRTKLIHSYLRTEALPDWHRRKMLILKLGHLVARFGWCNQPWSGFFWHLGADGDLQRVASDHDVPHYTMGGYTNKRPLPRFPTWFTNACRKCGRNPNSSKKDRDWAVSQLRDYLRNRPPDWTWTEQSNLR